MGLCPSTFCVIHVHVYTTSTVFSVGLHFAGFHLDKKNVLKELKKLPMMHDVEYVDYIQSNVLDDIPEERIGSDTIVMP